MWIFTQDGFVSAVRKDSKPDELTVRAREVKSLLTLAAMARTEIKTHAFTDYPYRIIVHEDIFKLWLSKSVDNLHYPNFKNQVALTRGKKFANALGQVWVAMLDVEDTRSRGKADASLEEEISYLAEQQR